MDSSSAEVDYHSPGESWGQNCMTKADCSRPHSVEFIAINRQPKPLVSSFNRAKTSGMPDIAADIAADFAIAKHPSSLTDFAESRGARVLPYSRTSTGLGARLSMQGSEGLDQSKHCSKSATLSAEVRSSTA